MIFVYIGAIIVFVGIGIILFVSSKKKEQKRLRKLSLENITNLQPNDLPESLNKEKVAEENKTGETSKAIENKESSADELENFSLNFDDKSSLSGDHQNEDEEEDEIDKRFAEYQKFLRENLEMDDEEEEIGPEVIDNFETTDFTDKSPDEIAELLKKMPPQMKQVLFSDALARNDFDDENEQPNSTQNDSN